MANDDLAVLRDGMVRIAVDAAERVEEHGCGFLGPEEVVVSVEESGLALVKLLQESPLGDVKIERTPARGTVRDVEL